MNNNMLHSECSSGCESGWTLYLEQSFLSHKGNENFYSEEKRAVKDEYEEEYLYMVSDASSGPPIFHEDQYFDNADNGCLFRPIEPTSEKNKDINGRRKVQEQQSSFLDDTASSPIFNFCQGKSALYEPYGFFQSSSSKTQLRQNQWFGGKMRMR